VTWDEYVTPPTPGQEPAPPPVNVVEWFAAKYDRPMFPCVRIADHGKTLTLDDTIEIRRLWRTCPELTVFDLAAEFGVSTTTIYSRLPGRRPRRTA
jgi:hypothetical protein